MGNKRIIAIVMDYEYRNIKYTRLCPDFHDSCTDRTISVWYGGREIKAEPGLFIVDGSEWFKAKNVWQVTVKDENGKETHIRATNYADANGPYHWPEGLPWTPKEENK
jgi:hypothetical protein